MLKAIYSTLKNKTALVLILSLLSFASQGQGRKIDMELVVLTPKAGDTLISRINANYMAKFIVLNHGPDTIKTSDKLIINASFGNVILNPYLKNFSKTLSPNDKDTIEISYPMVWDTDNPNTTFCGSVSTISPLSDSIKKESKSELNNNKHCQKVAHDSRLAIDKFQTNNISIYPNPSTSIFNIQLTSDLSKESDFLIYTLNGKEIIVENLIYTNNLVQIDLSYLPKGIYFLRLRDKDNVLTKSLLIY